MVLERIKFLQGFKHFIYHCSSCQGSCYSLFHSSYQPRTQSGCPFSCISCSFSNLASLTLYCTLELFCGPWILVEEIYIMPCQQVPEQLLATMQSLLLVIYLVHSPQSIILLSLRGKSNLFTHKEISSPSPFLQLF